MSPQKPINRLTANNLKRLEPWLETEYEDIVARSKKERAEIHWCDHTSWGEIEYVEGLFEDCPVQLIKECDPDRVNTISCITNNRKMRFLQYRGPLTGRIFTRFLSLLMKDCKRKVFLILYAHEAHLHNSVTSLLKLPKYKNKIEFMYLPCVE